MQFFQKSTWGSLKVALVVFVLFSATNLNAQKYITRNGVAKFESIAKIDEDVRAFSNTVSCALDKQTGDIAIQILIKSFQFKKALMQEHFNENYMESDKYPRASFTGKIVNFEQLDLTKPATHPITCKGELTMRGITKPYTEEGRLVVNKDGSLTLTTDFKIPCADFNIEIPKVVSEKIAEKIDVNLSLTLTAFNR
ncbi:MAG: YceI family protein [Luteibaculaceae bacterium]